MDRTDRKIRASRAIFCIEGRPRSSFELATDVSTQETAPSKASAALSPAVAVSMPDHGGPAGPTSNEENDRAMQVCERSYFDGLGRGKAFVLCVQAICTESKAWKVTAMVASGSGDWGCPPCVVMRLYRSIA